MSNGGVAGAIAAAAVARRRREILDAFRAVKANAPDRAVPESSLDLKGHLVFQTMLKRGIIVRLPDGRLYLNEAVEAAVSRQRHLILAAVVLLVVIGIAWLFAFRGGTP